MFTPPPLALSWSLQSTHNLVHSSHFSIGWEGSIGKKSPNSPIQPSPHTLLPQMRAGAVDAGNRTYALLTSLTSPANVAWLEDSALQLMVSGREYSALAVEYSSEAAKTGAVYAGLAAQAGEEYWTLSKTYVVQNFIELVKVSIVGSI